MTSKITMSDIAGEIGCSVAQVSRALAGKPKVAPEIRKKILEFAKARNYRNCANCHVPKIAVLTDWYGNFPTGIVNSLIRLSRLQKFYFATISIESMALLNEQNFDGAIAVCSRRVLARNWHHKYNIPLVVIDSDPCLLEGVGSVESDVASESRQVIEHLVKLGHRRIARICISSAPPCGVSIGSQAFEETAQQFGIQNEVTQEYFCDYGSNDFRSRIKTLLEEGYTGFFLFGIEICDTFFVPLLQSLGKRVPEDVSVIGFKSDSFRLNKTNTNLTHFCFDYETLVANAIDLMFAELAGKPLTEQRKIHMPLIPGQSTGPAPKMQKP